VTACPAHPRRRGWRRFCLALAWSFWLALASCATTEIAPAIDRLPPVFDFSLAGRLSVRVADRIDSGGIRWERSTRPKEERIALFSPIGTQVAEIAPDSTGGFAFRRGNDYRSAATVEELAAELLGVALDLDRVAGWLQGAGLDDSGRGQASTRDGRIWTVLAEDFRRHSNAVVARRLSLSSGDTVVRLVIDEWNAR
jgi:outer membrane lipoprotein LolB